MDHGDSFIHYGQHTKSNSGSNLLQPTTNSSTNKGTPIPTNSNNDGLVPYLAMPCKDNMPITKVTKIMRQVLPCNAQISEDAKVMIQQCASKYISFITRKANERCQREYRKILKAEDLFWAMRNLGFDNYVEPLTLFLHHYRLIESDPIFDMNRPDSRSRLVPNLREPIPVSVRQSIDNNGPRFGYDIGLTTGMLQSTLPPPLASLGSGFLMDSSTNLAVFDPMDMDELYGDGSLVEWLNDAMAECDPSGYYKCDPPKK